jgi:hypothetical protein
MARLCQLQGMAWLLQSVAGARVHENVYNLPCDIKLLLVQLHCSLQVYYYYSLQFGHSQKKFWACRSHQIGTII